MKLWKKYVLMVCLLCIFTAGSILAFTEESYTKENDGIDTEENVEPHAKENGDFDIWNGRLRRYTGSGGDVVIPEGVSVIDERAFYQCSTLTSVEIPGSVREIRDGAFAGCTGLTGLIMEEGLEEMQHVICIMLKGHFPGAQACRM